MSELSLAIGPAVGAAVGGLAVWLNNRRAQSVQEGRDAVATAQGAKQERMAATNRMLELGVVPAQLIFDRLETTETRLDTAEHELGEARSTVVELRTQMQFQMQELATKDAIIAEKDRRINELLSELVRERTRSAMLEGMLSNRSVAPAPVDIEPVPLPVPPPEAVA